MTIHTLVEALIREGVEFAASLPDSWLPEHVGHHEDGCHPAPHRSRSFGVPGIRRRPQHVLAGRRLGGGPGPGTARGRSARRCGRPGLGSLDR